jgi:hypothetical protein
MDAGVRRLLAGACGLAAAGGLAVAVHGQQGRAARADPGPPEYWMSAETTSGLGAMMGGRSSGAMMRALMGGRGRGPSFNHALHLQLGSPRRAPGEPSAEHLPPPGLALGASVPLVSPRRTTAPDRPELPGGPYERPRGRIVLYWGCGDHARAGQPQVIDFATLTAGRSAPMFRSLSIRSATPPSADRYATYGEWPNERLTREVPAGGSLVGDHVVRGNYTPDLNFSVARDQDFLDPVRITASATAPSGAVPLAWRPIVYAQAWFVAMMGSSGGGDLVMWNSSEVQTTDLSAEYFAPGEAARLVQQRVLLPAPTARCTVPAEVIAAAPQAMFSVTAYGGEANWSAPARPPQAPPGWRPDWFAKLRIKATYRGMLGMEMPDMGGDASEQRSPGQPPEKKRKRSILDGLGGFIPG